MSFTPPTEKQSIEEAILAWAEEEKELKQAICIHCKYSLTYNNTYFDYSYGRETKIGFHLRCQKVYDTWFKDWISMWAAIGWYARCDMRAMRDGI